MRAPNRAAGMREDELAVELRHYMKTLGAEDNFLMLCAGSPSQSNLQAAPPGSRRHHSRRDHAELSGPDGADLPDGGDRTSERIAEARLWSCHPLRWKKASPRR